MGLSDSFRFFQTLSESSAFSDFIKVYAFLFGDLWTRHWTLKIDTGEEANYLENECLDGTFT